MADYYQTLGLAKTATPEDIKKAYRRLAHEHHPDKGNGDAEKFKQINEAYQVLSNPEKRQQYDQFGTTFENAGHAGGFSGNAQSFDFDDIMRGFGFSARGGSAFGGDDAFDIFSDIFRQSTTRQNRRERGIDLEMEMDLTFNEAVFGAEKEISLEKKDTCPRCSGSGGEPGTKISTCPKCHGTGQIRTNRRTIFGSLQQVATCDRCDGSGKVAEVVCKECRGSGVKRRTKTLKVKIPAGVEDGMRIRVAGEGEVGYRGSNFGDLFIRINVAPHPVFRREHETIYSEIPISFYQAALGSVIKTSTIDGMVELKIPAGTQSGKVFRLKSRGVPNLNRSSRGDHLVTVRVVTPTKLTKKEKELFKKIAEEKGEAVDPTGGGEGFWDKF